MKFAIFAVVATSLVSAQNLSGIPACAQTCIRDSIVASGCPLEDTACQCETTKQVTITAGATQCVLSSCTGADIATTAAAGPKLCEAFLAGAGSASHSHPASSSAGVTFTSLIGTGASSSPTGASNGTALSTSARPTATVTTGGAGSGSDAPRTSSSSSGAAQTLMAGIGGVVGVFGGIMAVL